MGRAATARRRPYLVGVRADRNVKRAREAKIGNLDAAPSVNEEVLLSGARMT